MHSWEVKANRACVLSCVRLFATPQTHPTRLLCPWDFPRQEHWSRFPFPLPGDLPNPGAEPVTPASPALAGRFFTTEPPGKPSCSYIDSISPSGVNFIAVESGLLCPPNLPGQKVAAGRLGEGWVTALIFRAVLKLYLVRFLHPSLGLCSRSQAKPRGL